MAEAPIGRTIVLNKAFVEALDRDQLEGYVRVLVEASESHPDYDKDALRAELEQALDRVGVRLSPVEIDRTAEQLVGVGVAPLTISTNDGTVLFEREGRSSLDETAATHADPDDPDRPLVS